MLPPKVSTFIAMAIAGITIAGCKKNESNQLTTKSAVETESVSDTEVEDQLDNRIRYFIQIYGSQAELEKVSGKTVIQLKGDYREVIRDQLWAERIMYGRH